MRAKLQYSFIHGIRCRNNDLRLASLADCFPYFFVNVIRFIVSSRSEGLYNLFLPPVDQGEDGMYNASGGVVPV